MSPTTYVLIPVEAEFTQALKEKVKSWLREHIPQWKDFEVAKEGVYLGPPLLGPHPLESGTNGRRYSQLRKQLPR